MPIDEQHDGPCTERHRRPVENRAARSRVGAAAPEEVAAERGDAERPHQAERERNRCRRKGYEVTRAPIAALASERMRRAVDERAAEPEDERSVEPSADERPDRDDETVAQRVVEQRARRRRHEHSCDPCEPKQREHRLLPCVSRLVGVVPKRCEDRARRLQHEERSKQPLPVERRGLCAVVTRRRLVREQRAASATTPSHRLPAPQVRRRAGSTPCRAGRTRTERRARARSR